MSEQSVSHGDASQEVVQRALVAFNNLRATKQKPPITAEEMLKRIGGDESGAVIEEFAELHGQDPDPIDPKAGPFTHRFLTTTTHTNGWIYVVTLAGKLKFALDYNSETFKDGAGHKDLAEGGSLLAAGDIIIEDFDSIIWIDNGSGHFEPSGDSPLKVAKATFGRKGWQDITPVWHDVAPKTPCPNPACQMTVHSEWMTRAQKLKLAQKIGVKVDRTQT